MEITILSVTKPLTCSGERFALNDLLQTTLMWKMGRMLADMYICLYFSLANKVMFHFYLIIFYTFSRPPAIPCTSTLGIRSNSELEIDACNNPLHFETKQQYTFQYSLAHIYIYIE